MTDRQGLLAQSTSRQTVVETIQRNIGGCREEVGNDKCWAPAEFVIWGKLSDPSALGPRCYDHAAEHVGHHGLSRHANYALVNVAALADEIVAALEVGER